MRPKRVNRDVFRGGGNRHYLKPATAEIFRRQPGRKVGQPQFVHDRVPQSLTVADHMARLDDEWPDQSVRDAE
jgi:hypothetical protein